MMEDNVVVLSPVSDVLADFKAGRMVLIVDSVDRENEGDLAVAAEFITVEQLNFMLREARGLPCVSLGVEAAERLNLPLQVLNNNSPFSTAFTISVDHHSVLEAGVGASARVKTIRELANPNARAADFVSPGHVYPLVANPAGVVGRQGQTEGSFDLARLAGVQPVGVICEVLHPDGTMCRGVSLNVFAKQHGLLITSVEEILKYRSRQEILLRETAVVEKETDFGRFRVHVFEDDVAGKEHLALVLGDAVGLQHKPVLARIHSECLTGDVFGSLRCDCGEQLSMAARMVQETGSGIILYLRQEGRGIGLGNKLRAYELQDQGSDTVEANLRLGFAADARDYAVAAKILQALGVSVVRLMTNNPDKIEKLSAYGVEVAERVPLVIQPTEFSGNYLATKRTRLGHLL